MLFLGNNPAGRAAIPGGMPGDVYLGFPGVGGIMTGGTAGMSASGSSRRLCRRQLIPGWPPSSRP